MDGDGTPSFPAVRFAFSLSDRIFLDVQQFGGLGSDLGFFVLRSLCSVLKIKCQHSSENKSLKQHAKDPVLAYTHALLIFYPGLTTSLAKFRKFFH